MFWRKIDLKLRSFHVKVIAGLIIITVDTTQTESESFTNSGEGDDLAKVAHTRRNGENDEHSGQEIGVGFDFLLIKLKLQHRNGIGTYPGVSLLECLNDLRIDDSEYGHYCTVNHTSDESKHNNEKLGPAVFNHSSVAERVRFIFFLFFCSLLDILLCQRQLAVAMFGILDTRNCFVGDQICCRVLEGSGLVNNDFVSLSYSGAIVMLMFFSVIHGLSLHQSEI